MHYVLLDEIPVIKPLLDRFDLVFTFRTSRDEKAIREYTLKKSKHDDCLIPDYSTYLMKHIMYAKQIAPNPKISEEASSMLNEFYIEIAKTTGSPRIRETLFNISRMIARLKLRNIVTAEDAKEACQFNHYVVVVVVAVIVVDPTNGRRNLKPVEKDKEGEIAVFATTRLEYSH
jgi:DNA replicative helicase MCM subunit Mcm2 (Cdc46/Mcm family)